MVRISRSIIVINRQHLIRSVLTGLEQSVKAQGSFPVPFCVLVMVVLFLLLSGCSSHRTRIIETTAYCGCGQCCSWERGSWSYLKLDFWNRYVNAGSSRGTDYTGKTAHGTEPLEPQPGLLSTDSLRHPWMIPVRTVFPWLWLQEDGTIAADTKYYPFGTRMFVPGWGWGVVTDRGVLSRDRTG